MLTRMWRNRFSVLLLSCLSLGVMACGRSSEPPMDVLDESNAPPAYGDTLIDAGIGEPRTLLPLLATDSASGGICALIYNGLVKYDKNLTLTGDLAERWEVLDDGLTLIFYLRRDVRWHDGARFTAADVEFTYQALINPNIPTPYSGDFEKISQLEIIDEYTVRVRYKEPFSPAVSSWGMNIIPRHLLAAEDLVISRYGRNPVGTGPYRFKEWKTQQFIVLEANPDYFEGRPYLDRYVLRVIPDPTTMFLELQTRGIDKMGLSSLQCSRQTDTNFFKRHYRKYRYQGFVYTYMGYNLTRPLFQDLRVRQAINYAVNRREIIDGVLLGLGSPCTGPFAPRSWAYNPGVEPVAHDPQTAQQLLHEAGWRRNAAGILEKDGVPFSFTIITNQGNDERKYTAEIIQNRLRFLGIDVKIKIIEWSAFINDFINTRNFDAVLLGWSLSLDPDGYDIWHSRKTKPGEFNFIGYANPEVDMLLEQGRREFDQPRRQEIYHRIHALIDQDQPYLFLYTPDSLPIVSSRVHGIIPAPAGISYDFIRWYVPEARQRYISP